MASMNCVEKERILLSSKRELQQRKRQKSTTLYINIVPTFQIRASPMTIYLDWETLRLNHTAYIRKARLVDPFLSPGLCKTCARSITAFLPLKATVALALKAHRRRAAASLIFKMEHYSRGILKKTVSKLCA